MSYCSECGAKCNEVPTGKYSTETGEPLTVLVCPVDKCKHIGRAGHDWRQSGALGSPFICARCGIAGRLVVV